MIVPVFLTLEGFCATILLFLFVCAKFMIHLIGYCCQGWREGGLHRVPNETILKCARTVIMNSKDSYYILLHLTLDSYYI